MCHGGVVEPVALAAGVATVVAAAGLDLDTLRERRSEVALERQYDRVQARSDLVSTRTNRLAVELDIPPHAVRTDGRRADRDRLAGRGHVDEASGADLTVVAQLAAVHRCREGVRLLLVREHVALVGRQRDAAVRVAIHGVVAGGHAAVDRVVGTTGIVDRNGGHRDLLVGLDARVLQVHGDTVVVVLGPAEERHAVLDDQHLEAPVTLGERPVERVVVGRRFPVGVVGTTGVFGIDIRHLDLLVWRVVTTRAVAGAGLRDLADVSENEGAVVCVAEVAGHLAVPLVLLDRADRHLDGVLASLQHLVHAGSAHVLADVDLVGGRGRGRSDVPDSCRCHDDGHENRGHHLLERKHLSVLSWK